MIPHMGLHRQESTPGYALSPYASPAQSAQSSNHNWLTGGPSPYVRQAEQGGSGAMGQERDGEVAVAMNAIQIRINMWTVSLMVPPSSDHDPLCGV